MLRVKCPYCSATLKANRLPPTGSAPCPRCRATVSFAMPVEEEVVELAEEATATEPVSVPRAEEVDEEEERPRRRRRRRYEDDEDDRSPRRKPWIVFAPLTISCGSLLSLGMVLICGGGLYLFIDGCNSALSSRQKAEAQRIAAMTPEQKAAEQKARDDAAAEAQKRREERAKEEADRQRRIELGRISLAKYAQVVTGMTHKQVVDILGWQGEELSRVDLGGVQTVIIAWKNTDFSNMNVTFQNARVVAKAQFGLR